LKPKQYGETAEQDSKAWTHINSFRTKWTRYWLLTTHGYELCRNGRMDWAGFLKRPWPTLHCVTRAFSVFKMKVLPIVTLLHNLDLSHVQLCCQSMGVVNALESLQGVNDADHLTLFTAVSCHCCRRGWHLRQFRKLSFSTVKCN